MQKKERRTSEDVQITKELTVTGLAVTGFLGSKISVKDPMTGTIDGREYGIHVAQTYSSWPTEEEAIKHTADLTVEAYYALRETHLAKRRAKAAAAKVNEREAAAETTETVPPPAT